MKTITTGELKAQCGKPGGPTLVNTLGAEAFEKTKIPGAVNVPLESGDFAARVEQEAGARTGRSSCTAPAGSATPRRRRPGSWKRRASPMSHVTRTAPRPGRRKRKKSNRVSAADHVAGQLK
jgi:hypothetical protein